MEVSSNREVGAKITNFFEKDLRSHLALSIILTEFVEFAGSKRGEDADKRMLGKFSDP